MYLINLFILSYKFVIKYKKENLTRKIQGQSHHTIESIYYSRIESVPFQQIYIVLQEFCLGRDTKDLTFLTTKSLVKILPMMSIADQI